MAVLTNHRRMQAVVMPDAAAVGPEQTPAEPLSAKPRQFPRACMPASTSQSMKRNASRPISPQP